MGLLLVVVLSAVALVAAYRIYGRILARRFEVNDSHAVPSETMRDGVDFEPTPLFVVMGHHFSSIAGAGPIVGPVLAGLYFGWAPALLWIVLGCIFVGGVHDFGALMASVRHRAASVATVARHYMSPFAGRLFLMFILLALVYVIIAFLDVTAGTFAQDGAVASASILFVVLALVFGVFQRRWSPPMWVTLVVFVPLLFGCVAVGEMVPLDSLVAMPEVMGSTKRTWSLLLLAYCFVASVVPVWLLLQPRDFLSSFLLYGAILGGAVGLVVGVLVGSGGEPLALRWPAFVSSGMLEQEGRQPLGFLFPVLFITVACGACSGFHSLVCAGTTARQVKSERHAMRVGYGAMLIEGFVAVIALMTVAMLGFSGENFGNPLDVFARGIGAFLGAFGVDARLGYSFGLLAISTFLLTTLDTCTRLTRYIVQDVFAMDNTVPSNRYIATAAALVVPTVFVFLEYTDPAGNVVPMWKVVWPVFGATNQLLAGLALLTITIWLKRSGRRFLFAAIPMVGMLVVTMTALVGMIYDKSPLRSWFGGGAVAPLDNVIGLCALGLFVLGVLLIREAWRAFGLTPANAENVVMRTEPAAQQG